MSRADTAVMANRQRGPLEPMKTGLLRTSTRDAVLVTGHHTTGFPVSNFWESWASALATPRNSVMAEGGILWRAVSSSLRYLTGGGGELRARGVELGKQEAGARLVGLDHGAVGAPKERVQNAIELRLLRVHVDGRRFIASQAVGVCPAEHHEVQLRAGGDGLQRA
jgi:hypothetical protein